MFCSNCGKQVDDRAVICPGCGVLLNSANLNGVHANVNSNVPNQTNSGSSNAIAIVGFVLSFFIAIAGLICSIIGYRNAPQYNGNGKGLALAGIIISSISIAISFIWVIFVICMFPYLWI